MEHALGLLAAVTLRNPEASIAAIKGGLPEAVLQVRPPGDSRLLPLARLCPPGFNRQVLLQPSPYTHRLQGHVTNFPDLLVCQPSTFC